MKYLCIIISLLSSCADPGNDYSNPKIKKCENNSDLYRFYNDETRQFFESLNDDYVTVEPLQQFADMEGYPTIGDPLDKLVIKASFPDVTKDQYMFNAANLKDIARKNNQSVSEEYFRRLEKMDLVTGFLFHGTANSPDRLIAKNGLCNSQENVDLLSYYEPADTRGFISFTRSPNLAKRHGQVDFLTKNPRKNGGWVYVAFINGGYLDPTLSDKLEFEKKPDAMLPVYSKWQDQEVSQFGGVPWKFFVAYRKVNRKGMFEGPIFLRRGFKYFQPEAYRKIVASLSGAQLIDHSATNKMLDITSKRNLSI